ncbi:MAG TPA: transglutaminase family protein [Deltaproteobacteria bacterium]|nr:transglutaminase family protein [Deltaproteobacteria bacterium]
MTRKGKEMTDMNEYLVPTQTIDCDNEKIIEVAREVTSGCTTDRERAVKLFYFVRDSIPYSLYMISVFKEDFIASKILQWGKGYCVQKAVLLAALGRAAGIPTRLVFARIRNHKVPQSIVRMTGTNIFPRHGYTQFFLDDRWVSTAPTFDRGLCEKIGVPTVEWDGKSDAVLPEKDLSGGKYIEYVEKFGPHKDLPFEWIVNETSKTVGKDKRPWLSRDDNPAKG